MRPDKQEVKKKRKRDKMGYDREDMRRGGMKKKTGCKEKGVKGQMKRKI